MVKQELQENKVVVQLSDDNEEYGIKHRSGRKQTRQKCLSDLSDIKDSAINTQIDGEVSSEDDGEAIFLSFLTYLIN